MFSRLMTRPVIIREEHYLLWSFTKMKPLIFYGTAFEDTYEFIIYGHEMLHMIRAVKKYRVEFVTF